jgi:two-component system, cell cycle sensor histidine kinase and response regulator CckA
VQVILNLGVNARDAMAGGGTLTIRTANVDLDEIFASNHIGMEPGPYTLLQVTDSGVGMDDATKERVFDPFFTTKGDGTGLGLATVYGIVKQSGGHIWLYSEPGMGTTFKIYFPITEESVGDSLPAQIEPRSFEGPETILLVEDDDAVRPLVAQALRLYGYTVLEAGNGQQALDIAEHERNAIDLLLTDVVMPGMNGRELAEQLLAEQPTLHVLYTSGYPADTIIRHGIAEATAAYLEKPYLPDDLAHKIRDILDVPASA